jgi:ketosteroid isomerase-like protein
MEHADVQRWLDAYVDAWRSYNASAVGDLFAEDATYRWHPWDDESSDTVHGRDAIVAAWLGDRDEPGSWTAEYRPWAIEGDRAVAIGVSRYLRPDGSLDREYHNVFLCRFEDDARCVEFTEYFMRRTD